MKFRGGEREGRHEMSCVTPKRRGVRRERVKEQDIVSYYGDGALPGRVVYIITKLFH